MTDVEKKLYRLLLLGDAFAIIVAMAAGPMGHTSLSIGAAAGAVLISLCLIIYGLHFWPYRR